MGLIKYGELWEHIEQCTDDQMHRVGFISECMEKFGCSRRAVRNAREKIQVERKLKADNVGIIEAMQGAGVQPEHSPDMWLKTKEASIRVKNPFYVPKVVDDFKTLGETLIQDIRDNAKVFKGIDYKPTKEPLLSVISPADVHIGKLASKFETGEDYNSDIAVQRVELGLKALIYKQKGIGVEKILLLIGNDILHIDNPKRTTTAGTPQDTCGMWYDNFVIAKRLYFDVIMELRELAPVHVQFNPSNHDFMSGFHLSQVVEAMFSNCEDVTFECDMRHRKYFKFGVNLIGSTHGDGAKIDDLAILMAEESPEWSATKLRYFYIHHFHHKFSKDKMSVQIEALRTVSGTDGWHHREGHQHAPKAMECFLHDKRFGQIDRMIHYF